MKLYEKKLFFVTNGNSTVSDKKTILLFQYPNFAIYF